MVTLRRLLLEFGIVGDQAVKQKMKEIQFAATESKKTLLALNQQIEILNRANLGGLNIPTTSGAVLTTSEQRQAHFIAQQQQQEKRKEEQLEAAKLEVANEQIKATKDLLRAINTQIDTQKQSMNKIFQQFEMEPAYEGASVGRGSKGRFVSRKAAVAMEQIREKFEESVPQKLTRQDIEKAKVNIKELKSQVQQSTTPTSGDEELDILQAEINRLKQPIQKIPLVKPFIPEREAGIVEDENLEEFLKEVADEIKELKKGRTSEKRPKDELKGVLRMILSEAGIQKDEELYDPQTNVLNIIKQMENEKERKQKMKRISEIKSRLSEEYQRAEEVREKGYAVKPVERARQIQEDIQEKIEGFKESLKQKAIGFGKRIGLLESPEEFEQRRMIKFQKQAEEIVKKPEVQKIININFKDTTVDSKDRERLITERITQALRGL